MLMFCLNPCFRGSWFDGGTWERIMTEVVCVLILVFVEVGLMEVKEMRDQIKSERVLILVFVEVGLMVKTKKMKYTVKNKS